MKDREYTLVIAVVLQLCIIGAYNYIGTQRVIADRWADSFRSGFHPLSILFFGLSPILLWWSFRVFLTASGDRYWTSVMIQGVLSQFAFISCGYLASRQVPTIPQIIALSLSVVGAMISAIRV